MRHILFALGLFASLPLAQAAACLPYEPTHVFLRGDLLRKTFPGPPNYESIAQGDRAETALYLRLAEPVCMLDGAKASDNMPRPKVQLIQLELDNASYDRLRQKLGTTITVKGTLSSPWNGHHHGDLMMDVDPLPTNPGVRPASR